MRRGAAVVAAAALAAAALPLATYTLSLAAFGLLHVLCELRYVDARFSPRLPRATLRALLLLLAALAALRALGFAGLFRGRHASMAELALLGGLVLAVLPRMRGLAPAGAAAVAAIAAAIAWAPLEAMILLALLHNVTPVGFLAERLRGLARRRAMAACAAVFLGLPLLLLSGAPQSLLLRLGWTFPEATLLPAGPLDLHLGVFVPAPWRDAPWATHLFSAAVYLQVMHYAAVVYVLPRLPGEWSPAGSVARWPRPAPFHRLCAALAALLFVAFALSFRDARAFYGILASVHAWVEIPLLLLAPVL